MCTYSPERQLYPGLHQKVEGGNFLLYSVPLTPHLEYWLQFWCPQHKEDMELMKSPEEAM